jgi:hypothetical protein
VSLRARAILMVIGLIICHLDIMLCSAIISNWLPPQNAVEFGVCQFVHWVVHVVIPPLK